MKLLKRTGTGLVGAALILASGAAHADTTRAGSQAASLASVFATSAVAKVDAKNGPHAFDAFVGLMDSEMFSLVAPMVSLSCTSAQAGCILPLRGNDAAVPPVVPPTAAPPVAGAPAAGAGAGAATAGGLGLGGILPFVGLAALAAGVIAIAADDNNDRSAGT